VPILDLPDHSLHLERYPLRRNERLLPWNAADLYLLNHLREERPDFHGSLLLINDAFGTLGTALHRYRPLSWGDSHLSRLALEDNLARNGLAGTPLELVPADRAPSRPVDLVLLQLPRSLEYLEDILRRLRPCLRPGSRLVAGGMIKHTPAKAYRLLEQIIGPTRTGLGWKKARLAHCDFDPRLDPPPASVVQSIPVEEFGWTLTSRPGVFSAGRLDPGTRLLLKHLPASGQHLRTADLGCGNGILALVLAGRCPRAAVLGVDESDLAVASARDNLIRVGLTGRDITFVVGDGLVNLASQSLDLVVCNPPFHQGPVAGDHPAWRMFGQAHRALKPGGRLLIVGNRHLGYHLKLKRIYGNCEVLESDPKFGVLQAVR
jgi:16S rRNA (guanine1207-N2)-methyltransferase